MKKSLAGLAALLMVVGIISGSIRHNAAQQPAEAITARISVADYAAANKPSAAKATAKSGKKKSKSSTKKATTTTKATKTTKKATTTTKKASGLRELVNSQPLHSQSTGDSTFDRKIQSIVGTNGDTYDKVKRCYDWLIANVEYADYSPGYTPGFFSSYNPTLDLAYGPLFAGLGSCKNYSAATELMFKYIGLPNITTPDGYVRNNGDTEMQYHIWNVATWGGKQYIIDAEIEDKVSTKQGKTAYYYFFKERYTYDASGFSPKFFWDSSIYNGGTYNNNTYNNNIYNSSTGSTFDLWAFLVSLFNLFR